MYAAIRSPIVAGVTLVGAGAIAVSPIAANPPDVHLPAVRLTVMARNGLENPITVFAPILQQTVQDTQSLLTQESRNPFPIVRAGLLDLTSIFAPITAVPQPYVGVGNASSATTAAATSGQPLAGSALGAVTNPVGGVVMTAQAFLQRQLMVASRLLTAVPTAAFGVMVSTVNAVVQTALAVVQAGVGVVGGLASLNPVQAINSVINGAALVATVVEQTTIGQPQFKLAAADVAAATSIRTSRIPSIAVAINNGRRLIADALSPQLAAQAPVAAAQPALRAAPALKAAELSTTKATQATKVAKKAAGTKNAVADEVKPTVTTVQKAAAGASSSAAK